LVEKISPGSAYIRIEAEKCKGCRYCIAVCPHQIIGLSNRLNQIGSASAEVIAAKAVACTGCGACALMCPDSAISVFSTEGDAVLS
jgi:2-oxoglutarate ferredoxin oxidoreductase subunit delta